MNSTSCFYKLFLSSLFFTFPLVSFSHLNANQQVDVYIINPVPVLKRAPSPTEQIVEGLEPYFAQKREEKRIQVELAAQQERIRAELAAKLKLQAATASDVRWGEIANRWRLELQAAGQENNNKVLQDILQGYHPSKNSEYVIKILQSSLPMEMKKCVIEIINEQAKLYKKKNKDE